MKTSYLKTQITTASLNFNLRTNIRNKSYKSLLPTRIAGTNRTNCCCLHSQHRRNTPYDSLLPQTLPEQIVQITALPAKLFRCHRKTSGLQRLFSRYQLLIPIWNRENHWQNG